MTACGWTGPAGVHRGGDGVVDVLNDVMWAEDDRYLCVGGWSGPVGVNGGGA